MASSVFARQSSSSKKGQNGTVLVIGGSRRYTGAPLFAAKAALRSGAELVYIMCKRKALLSLKSLHEAIVMPIEYESRILDKTTACIVGPGLDRTGKKTMQTILRIINSLNARSIPIVVDADAIHYYKKGFFDNVGQCVVTPNYREKIGLVVKENHVCVYKGEYDLIVDGAEQYEVKSKSSGKRCGGQGDILSGVLATALSLKGNGSVVAACISACELSREASSIAFSSMGFSMLASDIIENLSACLSKMV